MLRGRKFLSKESLIHVIGEIEEEKEYAIYGLERLMAADLIEKQVYHKAFDEFQSTRGWKLERKSFQ